MFFVLKKMMKNHRSVSFKVEREEKKKKKLLDLAIFNFE
jgi:hypothetical protein